MDQNAKGTITNFYTIYIFFFQSAERNLLLRNIYRLKAFIYVLNGLISSSKYSKRTFETNIFAT